MNYDSQKPRCVLDGRRLASVATNKLTHTHTDIRLESVNDRLKSPPSPRSLSRLGPGLQLSLSTALSSLS